MGTPRRGRDREATAGAGGGLAGTGRLERFREALSNWGGVSSCLTSGPGVMEAEDCGSPGYIGRRAELRLLIG